MRVNVDVLQAGGEGAGVAVEDVILRHCQQGCHTGIGCVGGDGYRHGHVHACPRCQVRHRCGIHRGGPGGIHAEGEVIRQSTGVGKRKGILDGLARSGKDFRRWRGERC